MIRFRLEMNSFGLPPRTIPLFLVRLDVGMAKLEATLKQEAISMAERAIREGFKGHDIKKRLYLL